MKPAVLATAWLPLLLCGAETGACRLSKGMYNDWLAARVKPGLSGQAFREQTGTPSPAPEKIEGFEQEYRRYVAELSDAMARKDAEAVRACCEEAAGDRAGALICRLAAYLTGARADSATFLKGFPGGKDGIAMVWDLDSLTGTAGKTMFPPRGPSYRLIDELFLLALDERGEAIDRYFHLWANGSGDSVHYMDGQVRILLMQAPAVVVNQWMLLRRYRPRLNSVLEDARKTTSPAEMEKATRAVRGFCSKGNPDCQEILKMYTKR
jgi:hypothetical protein